MVLKPSEADSDIIHKPKEFTSKYMKHHHKITSCGVYYLCLMLWPVVTSSNTIRSKGYAELEGLVRKQFFNWCKFRRNVDLDECYDDKSIEKFILDCRKELYTHVSRPTSTMLAARILFEKELKEKKEKY